MDRLRSLGCLICAAPASIHHVMHAPGKERRRDHRFTVPLCPGHHQGNYGVHGLGSEKAFEALWGVDLVRWCMEAWMLRNSPLASFWTHGVTRCRAIAKVFGPEHKKVGGEREDEQALDPPVSPPVEEADEQCPM